MARLFAVTQNTDVVVAGVQAMPQAAFGSASIWFYPTYADTTTFRPMWSFRDGLGNHLELFRDSTNITKFTYFSGGGANTYLATSTNVPTLNVWNHVLVTWATGVTGSLNGWLNGTAFTTQFGPSLIQTWTNTTTLLALGNFSNDATSPPGLNFSCGGRLADFAWWNVVLNASEIAALAARVRPTRIEAASLKMYLPLFGLTTPEPNYVSGATNGTVTGAVLANHAPVSPYTPRWISTPPNTAVAAPASGAAALLAVM